MPISCGDNALIWGGLCDWESSNRLATQPGEKSGLRTKFFPCECGSVSFRFVTSGATRLMAWKATLLSLSPQPPWCPGVVQTYPESRS